MSAAIEALFGVDRLVHEPARLAILTVLDACAHADFQLLLSATGLPPGNLSSHLDKLEEAGLVEIVKGFQGKRSYTNVRLLITGRQALKEYWRCLDRARQSAKDWQTSLEQPARA